MELTGKCKEEFEKWMQDKDYILWFLRSPESMQWGVLQDYADSVGYDVDAGIHSTYLDDRTTYCCRIMTINCEPDFYTGIETFSRQEARIAAIESFNELFNKTRL